MQKYTALIIDDEEDSRSNTKNMLQNYCPEIEVIGEAASGMEGKLKIQVEKKQLTIKLCCLLLKKIRAILLYTFCFL